MPVFPPVSLSPSGDVLYQEAFAYASTSALRASSKYTNWRDSSQASLDTVLTENGHNTGKLHEATGFTWAGPNFTFGSAENHTVTRRRCYYPAGYNFTVGDYVLQFVATGTNVGTTAYGIFLHNDGVHGPHYFMRATSFNSGGSNLAFGNDADVDLGACGEEITTGGVWFDIFYEHDHSHVNDVSSPHVYQAAWISINRGAAMLLGERTQPLSSRWANSQIGRAWPLGVPDGDSGSPPASQNATTSEAEIVDLSAHPDYYGLSGAEPTYTPYSAAAAVTGSAGEAQSISATATTAMGATSAAIGEAEKITADVASPPTRIWSDTFGGTSGNPSLDGRAPDTAGAALGNWLVVGGSGVTAPEIIVNSATGEAQDNSNKIDSYGFTPDLGTESFDVEATCKEHAASFSGGGLVLSSTRAAADASLAGAAPADTLLFIYNNDTGNFYLGSFRSDGSNDHFSAAQAWPGDGTVLRMEVTPSTIICKANGTTIFNIANPFAAGGARYAGFVGSNFSGFATSVVPVFQAASFTVDDTSTPAASADAGQAQSISADATTSLAGSAALGQAEKIEADASGAAPTPDVVVDESTTFQTMNGWEAVDQAGQDDFPTQYAIYKDELLDKAVNWLGLNRLRVELPCGAQNPTDYYQQFIDGTIDEDTWLANYAYLISGTGTYHWTQFDRAMTTLYQPMEALAKARGEHIWMNVCYVASLSGRATQSAAYTHTDPAKYAAFVLAFYNHCRDTYGLVPDSFEISLEPDHMTDSKWTTAVTVANIVAAGDALVAAGYTPHFVAPSCLDPSTAATYIDAIVANGTALSYVDEFSFHSYNFDSDQTKLTAIGTKATAHGKRGSMLEWIGATSDTLLDDIQWAQISAFQQFTVGFPGASDDGGGYFLIDISGTPTVTPGSRTNYLRQYMHYVRRGAVRVDAPSTNDDVKATAYVNAAGTRVVVAKCAAAVDFSVGGLPAGTYGTSYTTASAPGIELDHVTIADGEAVSVSMAGAGVVTVYQIAASGLAREGQGVTATATTALDGTAAAAQGERVAADATQELDATDASIREAEHVDANAAQSMDGSGSAGEGQKVAGAGAQSMQGGVEIEEAERVAASATQSMDGTVQIGEAERIHADVTGTDASVNVGEGQGISAAATTSLDVNDAQISQSEHAAGGGTQSLAGTVDLHESERVAASGTQSIDGTINVAEGERITATATTDVPGAFHAYVTRTTLVPAFATRTTMIPAFRTITTLIPS